MKLFEAQMFAHGLFNRGCLDFNLHQLLLNTDEGGGLCCKEKSVIDFKIIFCSPTDYVKSGYL